jgi:hypothetical protein
MSFSARTLISESSIRIATERKKESGIVNIGCRYLDPLTGCRCGKAVPDSERFCNEHKGSEPSETPGLFASSLYRKHY